MLNIEHGGINEALADLSGLTGEPKYLQLALRFNHATVIGPASRREDRLTGLHANTQIPKFIGFQRIHELSGDARMGAAARLRAEDHSWRRYGERLLAALLEP
jgi:DUF1680 family protein